MRDRWNSTYWKTALLEPGVGIGVSGYRGVAVSRYRGNGEPRGGHALKAAVNDYSNSARIGFHSTLRATGARHVHGTCQVRQPPIGRACESQQTHVPPKSVTATNSFAALRLRVKPVFSDIHDAPGPAKRSHAKPLSRQAQGRINELRIRPALPLCLFPARPSFLSTRRSRGDARTPAREG